MYFESTDGGCFYLDYSKVDVLNMTVKSEKWDIRLKLLDSEILYFEVSKDIAEGIRGYLKKNFDDS